MATTTHLGQIVALLDQHKAGMKQAQIARALNLHPEVVAKTLASAQRRGVLLQEDHKGRIQRYEP